MANLMTFEDHFREMASKPAYHVLRCIKDRDYRRRPDDFTRTDAFGNLPREVAEGILDYLEKEKFLAPSEIDEIRDIIGGGKVIPEERAQRARDTIGKCLATDPESWV